MLAIWNNGTAAHRRYVIKTMAFMTPYMAICVAMMTTDAFDGVMNKPAGWVLAAVVSAPVIGQIWATLIYLNEADEFVRAVMTKTFVTATGVAFAVFCVWGFAESYADAPHAPGWLIYPLFWAAFGVISPFVRTSR